MAENEQQKTQNDSAPAHPPHPWSLQVARVAGIPIRLHFTFLLFLVYIGASGQAGSAPIRVGFAVAAFTCVVLHELGHSLVALRYGIPVADITLYPIGGLARIEKRPTPKQEFWIALAGPAVNFVIALIAWAVLGFRTDFGATRTGSPELFLTMLLGINMALFLFNLVPAFPMDGGRVLRALLASSMPPERATAIAAGIGQFLAILLGMYALIGHGNILYLFIALFVYIGAGQEATYTQQASVLDGATVSQAMITDVRTLPMNSTLKEAADVLLATSQHDFPVMLGEDVQGLLTRNGLLRGLAEQGPGAYVAGIMNRAYLVATPDDDLANLLQRMQEASQPVLVLGGTGRLLGMVTGENLAEFFAVRQIYRSRGAGPGWGRT
jgi:stage IV sporulation protein FB